MAGKGHRPRPFSVNEKVFSQNWNDIFGVPCPRCKNGRMKKDGKYLVCQSSFCQNGKEV
jgi:hypothetical protein